MKFIFKFVIDCDDVVFKFVVDGDVICDIAIYADDATLCSKCD